MTPKSIPSKSTPKPSSPKPFSRTATSTHSQLTPRPRTPLASSSRSPTPDQGLHAHTPDVPIPDYLSPIHRPSVNPIFNIDTRNGSDFAPGTNLSGCKMVVEMWAHQPDHSTSGRTINGKGKEKEKASFPHGVMDAEWKVLETWDVDLNELVPVPDSVCQFTVIFGTIVIHAFPLEFWRIPSHAT